MIFRRLIPLLALALISAGLLSPAGASGALSVPQPDPPNVKEPVNKGQVKRATRQALWIARQQLGLAVSERRGDNVPRYRNGKGRIAPFSISDQWCVAFGTWVWNRVGFRDYLGAKYIWKSHDGTRVAIQVTDMSLWAKRTGHWSARAKPGYLVAYDIGLVTGANRRGQAVWAIEGNKGNRVRRVRVPMANVTGYISPVRLSKQQIVNAIANPDMVVPEPIAEDPETFARSPEMMPETVLPDIGSLPETPGDRGPSTGRP